MRKVLNPEGLAAKYIELLERDLKLERLRLETLRRDVEFYRGKCERLEMSVFSASPAQAPQDYVNRSQPKKPSINQIRLEGALRPKFSEIREKWNRMTLEEQEKAVDEGGFKFDEKEATT